MRRSIQLLTLQCLPVIVDEGSFLAASQRLNMHHTALSRRVRDLELTLGVALFDRHPGGVRPTPAGKQFLSNLRRVLTNLDGTLSAVKAGGRGENGNLAIGIDAPLPACGYFDAIVTFMRGRPDLDIRFFESPRSELNAGLSNRTLDLVIAHCGDRRHPSESLPLWQDRIVVAMPSEHRLACRSEIEWAELSQETILSNMQSVDVANTSVIPANASPPFIVLHDVSRASLLNLVRKGLGVTLLPESEAANIGERVILSVLGNDGNPIHVRYDAHWRRDNSNPVLAAFVEFLRRKYPSS